MKAVRARPPSRRREMRHEDETETEEEAMREEVTRPAETAEPADEGPGAAARHAAEADMAASGPEAPADADLGGACEAEARIVADGVSEAEPEGDPAAVAADDEADADAPEPDAATPEPEGGSFAIPARMRPEDAEAMLARLKGADPAGPLAVDASAVEMLSTPAVLGLVAAARARAEAGGALAVERPSPGFIDAFSDLGLFHDLMKMEFRT